jgi:hypothetical protein
MGFFSFGSDMGGWESKEMEASTARADFISQDKSQAPGWFT